MTGVGWGGVRRWGRDRGLPETQWLVARTSAYLSQVVASVSRWNKLPAKCFSLLVVRRRVPEGFLLCSQWRRPL